MIEFVSFKCGLPDVLGILGVTLILVYYFLLQAGKCTANTPSYSIANLIGSCLILISLWFNWNLASVIIEVFWLGISLYGLVRSLQAKTRIIKNKK